MNKKFTPDELIKLLDQELVKMNQKLVKRNNILVDVLKRARQLNEEIDEKLKRTNSVAYYELEDLLLQQELLLEEEINL